MLNIDRSDWIRQICKSYDLNPTRPIVKKNLQPNPSHQPLQTDPTQRVGLDWVGCTLLPEIFLGNKHTKNPENSA